MFRQNIISVLLALIIAVGVTYGIFKAIQKPPSTDPELDKTLNVLVAAKKLKIGDTMKAEYVTWREWPFKLVTQDFLIEGARKAEDVNGSIINVNLGPGEPLKQKYLVTHKEGGFLSKILKPGKRAVSVSVNSITGVSGFILPGDRVDLVLTHKVIVKTKGGGGTTTAPAGKSRSTSRENRSRKSGTTTETKTVTEVIMSHVKVLAVDQLPVVPEKTKAKRGKTLTLEVTPTQANILAFARRIGQISLTLRPIDRQQDDVEAHVVDGTFFSQKLAEELTKPGAQKKEKKIEKKTDSITIIRGNNIEKIEIK